MPRLPGFVGTTYADLTRPAEAQEAINLFMEKVESGKGANDAILRRAPGMRLLALLTDKPARAAFSQNGRCFVVAGTSLYEIFEGSLGAWTRIGTVASDDHPAAITSNGAGGNQLFIVTGGIRYIYGLITHVLTTISDSIAGPFRGAEFLDGYFLTRVGNFVYASALEDGTSWNAASKAQRSIAADDLQRIVVDDHRTLWLVGSHTSEPWYNNGLTPFAFTPVTNSFMGHGTGASGTVVRFDNTLFALAENENGGRYAFIVNNGQTAQRISTHAIENAWRRYTRVDDAFSWTYNDMGHTFVVLTFPTAEATWVYDASVGMWHRRGLWDSSLGRYRADVGTCHCYAFGRHLVGSSNSNILFEQSLDIASYDSNPIRWLRRTPHLSQERKIIYYDKFELIMEVGQGSTTGFSPGLDSDAADPLVSLTYSDDGGYTWASERTRNTGAKGEFRTRPIWRRLGRSVDRVFEVNGTSDVKMTLIDALIEVH